jgi:hypothetical protein
LVIGNGIFGAVWTMALWSPKYWYFGLYSGGLLGFFFFHFIFGATNSKNSEGYVTYFNNGMTKEDR